MPRTSVTVTDQAVGLEAACTSATEAAGTVLYQGIYPQYAQPDFGGTADGSDSRQLFNNRSAVGLSSEYTITGFSKALFKIELSTSAVQLVVRVWLKDHNGSTPYYWCTASYTITNIGSPPSGITSGETGFAHGTAFVVETYGAKTVALELVSITAATTASAWVAAV